MYRLLIVDDEPAIVEGLFHVFSGLEDLDLDIGKAYSAFEALDIARKTKIDVLLSDIRMPETDGLQLVDEMLFYWPNCKIIFLTGYSDFHYARQALQKRVDNYILKTEDEDVIAAAVRTAIGNLEAETDSRIVQEKVRLQQRLMEPLMVNEYVKALLSGETLDPMLPEAVGASPEFLLAEGEPVLIVAGKVVAWPHDIAYPDKAGILHALARRLNDEIPSVLRPRSLKYDHATVVCLLQPDSGAVKFMDADGSIQWTRIVQYVKGLMEPVQNATCKESGASVSFMMSGEAVSWNRIPEQFEAIRALAEKPWFNEQAMTIVELGDGSTLRSAEQATGTSYVERVHKFIDDNLGADLSLARIGEAVYLNPSYLSRYYKQATGRKLSEHIQAVKAETAKRLLGDMSLKINEISSRLGFESPSYFTAFFRKAAGVGPQEFRDRVWKDGQ